MKRWLPQFASTPAAFGTMAVVAGGVITALALAGSDSAGTETCGRVVDSVSGDPLAGVVVSLVRVSDANSGRVDDPLSTTVTDELGEWCLLPVGADATTDWSVLVDGSGIEYETGWPSVYDDVTGTVISEDYVLVGAWANAFQVGEGNNGVVLGDIHLDPLALPVATTTSLPRSTTTTSLPRSTTTTSLPRSTTTSPVATPTSLPRSTTTTPVTTTLPQSTTTMPATTTTTLAPAAPTISDAYSGSGQVDLPSECATRIYVTLVFADSNDDEMSLRLNWSASEGSPSSGSVSVDGLRSGSERVLLGTFDWSHRGATIYVTMTLTDTSGLTANRGFQIQASLGGGTCPSTFG